MAEVDYDEIVEGTVDEVKERVREDDLDIEKVLAAERANKDRVTLVDWLDEQVEETAADTGEAEAGEPGIVGGGSLPDRIIAGATSHLFIAGLVIGVAIALAVAPSAGGAGMSPAGVGDSVETYFSQNTEDVPLQSMDVQQVQRLQGSDLYRLDMVLSAKFLNRTVQQNMTAYTTSNARYVFLRTRPIDTERPLAAQLGGGQQQQQPQQQ